MYRALAECPGVKVELVGYQPVMAAFRYWKIFAGKRGLFASLNKPLFDIFTKCIEKYLCENERLDILIAPVASRIIANFSYPNSLPPIFFVTDATPSYLREEYGQQVDAPSDEQEREVVRRCTKIIYSSGYMANRAFEEFLPEVYRELLDKYGEHPGLHQDYAHAFNMDAVARVYKMLMKGIKTRADICVDLLSRNKWDLFLTVFGETHGGGHNFWQFQPEHPLYASNIPGREKLPKDPLKDIYKCIDEALAKILKHAPQDAKIVIFLLMERDPIRWICRPRSSLRNLCTATTLVKPRSVANPWTVRTKASSPA